MAPFYPVAATSAGCNSAQAATLSCARSESIIDASRDALLGGREIYRQMSSTLRQVPSFLLAHTHTHTHTAFPSHYLLSAHR